MCSVTALSWATDRVIDAVRMDILLVTVLKIVAQMIANVMVAGVWDTFQENVQQRSVPLAGTASGVVQLTIWLGIALRQQTKHSVIIATKWVT